jgi:PAS domain S-box-containing protein
MQGTIQKPEPSGAHAKVSRGDRQRLLGVIGFVSLGLLAAGYGYYRHEAAAIRAVRYRDLYAIADLKAGEILHWREDWLTDARLLARSPLFIKGLESWLLGGRDSALETDLHARLNLVRTEKNLKDVLLVDSHGEVLLTAEPPAAPPSPEDQQVWVSALAAADGVIGDFSRDPRDGVTYIDVAAPVLDASGRPLAVLVLRTDPRRFLYPLIQSWPTPSRTAETLLIHREGNDVVFLNELRHRQNSALDLRIPLSRADVPAVRAALGETGICEGRDYRGVDVLADIRALPGTPWFMVAKVDSSELLAEARYRAAAAGIFIGLSILLSAALATALHHRHRQVLLLDLYTAERERREAQEEIRATLYSIGDGVVSTDAAGRVQAMNPAAESLTGWQEAEVLGRPAASVLHLLDEETRIPWDDPVQQILHGDDPAPGHDHGLLITRGGAEHPIALRGAVVRNAQGVVTGTVLVFRDRSIEQAAAIAIQEQRRALAHAAQMGGLGHWTQDIPGDRLVWSPEFRELMGIDPDQPPREDLVRARIHPGDLARVDEALAATLSGGGRMDLEFRYEHPQRAERVIHALAEVTRDARGRPQQLFGICQDVTERARADLALRESKERFHLLVENVKDYAIVMLDPQGNVASWNPGAERIYGYDAREIIGRGHACFFPDEERRRRHPEEVLRVASIEGRFHEQGWRVRRDGSRFWADLVITAIRGASGRLRGFARITRDLTEQRRAEIAIRDSEERFRQLFEHLVSGVALHEILLDDAGRPCDYRFLEVNPAFEKLTGLKARDITGRTVREVLPGTEQRWIETFGRVALTGEPARFEEYHAGLGRYYEVIAYRPRPRQFAVVFTDVTESRRAAENVGRLNTELEERVRQRTAQLEAANHELEAFSYSVSHDLRAPLRVLDSYSAALLEDHGDRLDEEARKYLEGIRSAAGRMDQLIADLLGLARVSRAAVTRHPVDLSQLARRTAADLAAHDPGRQVEFRIPDSLPVEGDPHLLQLVIENLLGNAWKFTNMRSRAVIELGTTERDGERVYFVRDDGAGFDMACAGKLFAPFQRLHPGHEFPGTGIGLATVQRILQRHGGRIWPEAAIDRGATFYFTLWTESSPEPSRPDPGLTDALAGRGLSE